jgi:glycosyltransferase involved in cell wall biosynthesis
MRLGVAWVACSNAYYRAVDPLRAMERRGHQVVWPTDADGEADLRRLAGCDVVHVYRRGEDHTRRALMRLAQQGVAIVYDNDDDHLAVPREAENYKDFAGLKGQRIFAASVQVARLARRFTTTNDRLAESYRQAGVDHVEVIGNYLAPDVARPRHRHDGVVIGWFAGAEHQADIERIEIADALQRLMAEHPQVRVECIGRDLDLPERYRYDVHVPFDGLPGRIGGFDIGIAPLADIPCNWARSDIKLKEYAASGVPWLASPIGPYQGLGEEQGGRLVADEGWFEALDRLVSRPREQRRLSRKAQRWAKRQTIDAVADRWEQVFAQAAGKGE